MKGSPTMSQLLRILTRVVLVPGMLLLAGVSLSGCNTVEGAGKDLEAAGDAIGDFARSTKKKIEE